MAQADRQPAPTFVSLKAVSDALQNRAGESMRGVKRFAVQRIAAGRYRHRGAKEPPPGFCRSHPDNYIIDGSDITNPLFDGGDAFTLPGVSLIWEDAVAAYPELGVEPPQLGTSRVEVSFTALSMSWFETLVTRLRRKPPPPSMAQLKEPTGWQAERVLRVMRTRLYPPAGRAPRGKELKQLEGEIGAVLALEEERKPRAKSAPSPEVVSAVVAFLGRRDD